MPEPEGARWMRGAPNSPDHNGPIHCPQDARWTKGEKQRKGDMSRGSITPRHRVGPVGGDFGFHKGQRVSRLFWPDGSQPNAALAPPGTGSEVSGSPPSPWLTDRRSGARARNDYLRSRRWRRLCGIMASRESGSTWTGDFLSLLAGAGS